MNVQKNLYDIVSNEKDATATIDKFKDRSDPAYIGPGKWDDIHEEAYNAITEVSQLKFIKYMKRICNNFPCKNCKKHCQEYVQNNPLEEYLNVTMKIDGVDVKIGMFVWAWKFHNSVNKRLGKPIMSFDTALNLYSPHNVTCNKECDESENVKPGL